MDQLIIAHWVRGILLYLIFTDPETFKPTMEFLKVVGPADSQDAPGLKNAVFAAFHKHSLEYVLNKIVFLSSDGASYLLFGVLATD